MAVQALGPATPLQDAGGAHELGVRHLLGQHGRVRSRVDRVGRVADHQRGRRDRPTLPEDGATRPKKMPCTTAAIERGRWSQGVEPDPAPERTRPRGTGRVASRSAVTVTGRNRATNIRGAKAMIPASTALSRTGISSSRPRTRSGASVATSRRDVGSERGPAHDGLIGAEVVEQGEHLLAERGHRVDDRVLRPVGASVAEQVEGDDVEPLGGEHPRERLAHPARHQLTVDQHDPPVAGAVLGVLQPVGPRRCRGRTGRSVRRPTCPQRRPSRALRGTGNRPNPAPMHKTVPMSDNGRRWAGPAAVAVALLGVYVAGTSAVLFRPEGSDVSFWWPAAGISVALVALVPRRQVLPVVLGIFAVSLAANLSGGQTADLSIAYSIANAAEALVAGMLLKGPDGRLVTLSHLSDFVRLVVAAVAGALVVGVVGALAAYALDDGSLPTTLRNIFTSHMAATMVIVPVAMTWRQRTAEAPQRSSRSRWCGSRPSPVPCSSRSTPTRSRSRCCRSWCGQDCGCPRGR